MSRIKSREEGVREWATASRERFTIRWHERRQGERRQLPPWRLPGRNPAQHWRDYVLPLPSELEDYPPAVDVDPESIPF